VVVDVVKELGRHQVHLLFVEELLGVAVVDLDTE